jgi:cytidylate kinase
MYRALTWLAGRHGVAHDDGPALAALARAHPVELDPSGAVMIGGSDVTTAIRSASIDRAVPVVARQPEVREVMRVRQRELGEAGDAVMEGRDIGTVVAPDAEVKVYLVADAAVRAGRRLAERPEIGADALVTDLRLRDESDAERTRQASDAHVIDTTDLQIDDVVDRIEQLVRARSPA